MKYLCLLIIQAFVFSTPPVAAKDYPNSEELRAKYPTIDDGSTRADDKEILCPFLRILERTGTLDAYRATKNSDLIIGVGKLAKAAKEFGCGFVECNAVAQLVSLGQLGHSGTTKLSKVNISQLHLAKGTAHDCGINFEYGGTQVSQKRINQTLERLEALAKEDGKLVLDDLVKVKLQTCADEGVEITGPGKLEMKLIYSFLGGHDRGYIELSDVKRFLDGKLPLTKSKGRIKLN